MKQFIDFDSLFWCVLNLNDLLSYLDGRGGRENSQVNVCNGVGDSFIIKG